QSTGTTASTGNSQSSPWTVQQPYLTQAFGNAQHAYDGTTNLTPSQLSDFMQQQTYGMNNGAIPSSTAAAGSSILGSAAGGIASGISGLENFKPNINMGTTVNGANQYAAGIDIPGQVKAAMQPAMQEAQYITNPGIDASAAASGNINSSRDSIEHGLLATNLGETAANIGSNLEANAYNTGAGLSNAEQTSNNANALAALTGLAQSGAWDTMAGTGANTGAVGQASGLYGIANTGIAGENTAPYQSLAGLMSIIGN